MQYNLPLVPIYPKKKIILKQNNDDVTDRYIALFLEGLIDKEDFIKLVSTDKQPHQPTNYIQ